MSAKFNFQENVCFLQNLKFLTGAYNIKRNAMISSATSLHTMLSCYKTRFVEKNFPSPEFEISNRRIQLNRIFRATSSCTM